MQPIIGITPNMNDHKYTLNNAYCHAISKAGGIPLILPYENINDIACFLRICHGFLLTGGGDIHSRFFKQPLHPLATDIDEQRDIFELNLCEAVLDSKKPMLCICRGIQILNVATGGDIEQHIDNHLYPKARTIPVHSVIIKSGSKLYDIIQRDSIHVNSIHHQAIAHLGKNLGVSGVSLDNIIEAVEHLDNPFVIGVQWHPEILFEKVPVHFALFQKLIQSCT